MGKKIVIYGMGQYGVQIANVIIERQKELDIEVLGLCDKKKQDNTLFPYELERIDYDFIVITSKKWYMDIKNELSEKYNINPEKMMLYSKLEHLFDGSQFYCNICGSATNIFLSAGMKNDIFKTKKITGGGYRSKCVCPICGSSDRSRWLEYVLETDTNVMKGNSTILHFAPEAEIEKKIREKNANYYTADIVEGRADTIEDITCISYEDNTFDYIICNHVMEHIENEAKAFHELKRCIKNSGSIIFSVPICWDEPTYEDKTIISPAERLKYYGQEDHVRLYGYDLEQKMINYGFKVRKVAVNQQKYEELEKLSLIFNDTIWILKKEN